MVESNMSRRELLRRLGIMSALSVPLGVLPGCGGGQKDLAFYGTGTLDVQREGWRRLREESGITVRFKDNGNDTGPVIAQMITGTAARDYHVGGLQGGAERALASAGCILPWDTEKLSHWGDVWQLAKDIPYARVDGSQFGLPIALNADSMVYRPDLLGAIAGFEQFGRGSKAVVDTYAVLFDERLSGRTSMEDAWINSAIFAAIYLKENGLAQIDDPGDLTDAELKEVMGFLVERKRAGHFVRLWSGWEDGVRLMRSGEVVIMTGWEPIVYELRSQKVPAEYANPREGYEGWSNDLVLHQGAAADGLVDAAHEFANWLYAGFYGQRLGDLRGYVVPSDAIARFAEAESGAGESVRAREEHVRAKFRSGRGYWQNVRPREFRLYEEWWSRVRAA